MNCLDLGPFDCAHVNILDSEQSVMLDWISLDLGQLIMLSWIGYVLCARLDCLHVAIDYMFLIR